MLTQSHLGAYGFRLVASNGDLTLPGLIPVPPDADEVRLSWRQGNPTEEVMDFEPDRARIAFPDHLEMEMSPDHVAMTLPEDPTPEAVVHPLATTPLAILARWRGNPSIHAGAVLHEGGACVVCGHREAGKSTMLAMLAQRGLPIVADDLVVVDGGDVLSGPSCVDLRDETAARFPEARFLGNIGQRDRYRLLTPPAPPRVPLRAVFLLGWSDEPVPEVTPLGLEERAGLVHLFDYCRIAGLPAGATLLELLAVPMWRLTRPRSWEAADAVVDTLLTTADGH